MPRKKNVTTAPEEPLAEPREELPVSAETGETGEPGTLPETGGTELTSGSEAGEFPQEGGDAALPSAGEAADLPPEDGSAEVPVETGDAGFPPDTGEGDFPPAESPYPDGDAVSGEGPVGEEPAPKEQGVVSKDGDAFYEGDLPSGTGHAGGDIPGEEPPAGEDPVANSEYDALLHEWSEKGGAEVRGSGDEEEPLILPPSPGAEPEPEPSAEPEEPSASPDNATEAPPRAARPRRRRTPASDAPASPVTARRAADRERVLTIEARDEVQTEDDREAAIWHEIQNADWTRRILTGTLDGVEQTESGLTLAVVNYKGFRVAIPLKEMMLHSGKLPTGQEYLEVMDRLRRILVARLGSEIDFVVKGHDNKSRSAVGSRKDAMLRKRQSFYLDKDELGEPMIYEGRVVQARVVAVAEKIIRVEVFGVECAIVARGLSRSWVGNAAEQYSVGDRILVRVLKVNGSTAEDLTVTVDVRSVFKDSDQENLKKCVPQGRYAGRVTDIRNGVVYVRLNNGVNAIAHSCYDRRAPGKRDDVSFSVTRLDPEQGVAIGIITRIIKQNL